MFNWKPPVFVIKALTLHYETKKRQLQRAFLLNILSDFLKADSQQIQLLFCTMKNVLCQTRAPDSGLQHLLVESIEVRWLQHFLSTYTPKTIFRHVIDESINRESIQWVKKWKQALILPFK